MAWDPRDIPEEERHHLTEAAMNAWMNGELDKGFIKTSWEEKLFATMQQMRQDFEFLKRQVERVAEKFPGEERHHLTTAVMNAWEKRELEQDLNKPPGRMSSDEFEDWQKNLLKTMQELRELPVAASAVKFCSNLFREVSSEAKAKAAAEKANSERFRPSTPQRRNPKSQEEIQRARRVRFYADKEAQDLARWKTQQAARICHRVLTGELSRGPKWAEKAAESSQPNGQHFKRGRLEKVNAVERSWKVSLKNVCKDECHALVKEIQKETKEIYEDVQDVLRLEKRPSYEEACARRVVQKVEAEILGCCAEKMWVERQSLHIVAVPQQHRERPVGGRVLHGV